MFLKKDTVGIWGYGIVGASALSFVKKQYPECAQVLYDTKELSLEQQQDLARKGCALFQPHELSSFLATTTAILASPGIDLTPYRSFEKKWITELDLFFTHWKKPVIAITGTLGKTTITDISSHLLRAAGLRVATGGNIGTGMLDLIDIQDNVDIAVLELSSFQLEYAQHCNPDLAIITNLFPNHLDRHKTMEQYLAAKLAIARNQQQHQKTLIPLSLLHDIRAQLPDRSFSLHSNHRPTAQEFERLRSSDALYYCDQEAVYRFSKGEHARILDTIPATSYPENWVIMTALCDIMQKNPQALITDSYETPDHRLEHIATIETCAFFDDSKATIMPAVIAAVQKLHDFDTILLLGGTSKGVDRAPYFAQLQQHIKMVITFGGEAQELAQQAQQSGIKTGAYATLEEACAGAWQAQEHFQKPAIVLSPGGASFDLFKDYKARGKRFQEIVKSLQSARRTEPIINSTTN